MSINGATIIKTVFEPLVPDVRHVENTAINYSRHAYDDDDSLTFGQKYAFSRLGYMLDLERFD